jgi:hypothetical protein
MLGRVYQIKIQGHTQKLPHPHVVLIELAHECLLVPAFSEGGREIEGLIRACQKIGYSSSTVTVLLDNKEYVAFRPPFTGARAHWAVARVVKMDKADLATPQHIGQMNDAGLLLIAKGYEGYANVHPSRASADMRKKVRKLIAALARPDEIVTPTASPSEPELPPPSP